MAVQCADSIVTSMKEILENIPVPQDLATIVKSSIDAADTIQLCAQHQKSIVDDILTISKLDSNLLLITPVSIRPVKIVQQGKSPKPLLKTNDLISTELPIYQAPVLLSYKNVPVSDNKSSIENVYRGVHDGFDQNGMPH